MNKVIQIVTP